MSLHYIINEQNNHCIKYAHMEKSVCFGLIQLFPLYINVEVIVSFAAGFHGGQDSS